jgi:hypothetical protein
MVERKEGESLGSLLAEISLLEMEESRCLGVLVRLVLG